MPAKPLLYTSPGSQHCRRVMLLVQELPLAIDTRVVDVRPPGMGGENESPPFLALNPNGKVPVLTHGDALVLFESNAIMAYLCDLFGETPLLPRDPATRGQVLAWQFWQASHLSPTADGFMAENMGKPMFGLEPDPERIKTLEVELDRWARVLEHALTETPFLVAGQLTCADLSVAAALMYAHAAQFSLDGYPQLAAWLRRMQARESWRETEPPPMDLSLTP
ncbi:MAG: glutathione S-transferase family protein [Pseudomonadota bacterium]